MQRSWLTPEKVNRENGGGKAGELAHMQQLGVRVPDFIVLSCEAATRIRSRKPMQYLPEELAEMHALLAERLPDAALYSVRSSANREDGESTSFAGLFETYLNVPFADLPGKVLECLASLDQEHVRVYMEHHQMEAGSLEMAVVIQKMVPAEKSGVLFTANPKGLLNETVVVAGLGLGEGVVQGEVPVTTYYLKRDEELQYYERQGDSPLLSAAEMAELLCQSDRLQEEMGPWLDCEFAIQGGRVYLLQVRPITTLLKNSDQVPLVYNNSNLMESYPGLTLPLTESFIQFAYQQVFKGVAWRFSHSEELLAAYEPALRQLVQAVNGRMYYNMNHLYSLLQFLPFPKLVLPIWQEMMGMRQGGVVIQPEMQKELGTWESLRISVRILKEFCAAPRHMERLNAGFEAIEQSFRLQFDSELSAEKVKALYAELAKKVLAHWDVTLVNDLYAFVYTGILQRLLERWGSEADLLHWNKWFSGIPAMTSMEPVWALQALAERVKEDGLREELQQLTSQEAVHIYLAADETGFGEQFMNYIERYGDRSLEELKLETETFRTNPFLALEQLLRLSENGQLERFRPKQEETAADWENQLSFAGVKRTIIRFLAKRARLGIQHRETSRLNRSRIYGMVRTMMLRLGKIAVDRERLASKGDIFYLTLAEVEELSQTDNSRDWQKLVEARRSDYRGYGRLPAYGYLLFQESAHSKTVQNAEAVKDERSLKDLRGIPTSSGVVTGEVLVVADPKKAGDVSGKILVTSMTDPGWVFLLTQAAGVIAEKGSLLSHTAIISRELGIPAVVNVRNATTLLESGQRVQMDGTSGKITILE